MRAPKIPDNEEARLEELASYSVLDTPPEQAYDDIVALAARLLNVPTALVSLVDESRQWFKARVGLDATETSREVSFCGHAVADGELLLVPDATKDIRFVDNPLVMGDPLIRFYVGAPLRTPSGHVLGTLCALDQVPRAPTPDQVEALEMLARQVVSQLELRRGLAEARRAREESEHANQRAERSEAARHRFFELSRDLLCIADFDGYYRELNPAWTRTLGFSLEELKSRPFLEFFHPDDREATRREAERIASAGDSTYSFENRHITKAGDYRWLVWSAAADRERGLLMAVARDTTKHRQERDALKAAKLQAESANRAKSKFLANMSHELRTPLNSVIGFTNVLLRNKRGVLASRELDFLQRIKKNGHHLLKVIDDVLDLGKIEAGEMSVELDVIDLGAMLGSVAAQLQGQATETATVLRALVPPGVTALFSDSRLLRQVIINLVGNSLKFAAGGAVEIRVVTDAKQRPVRIEVADDGIGIAKEKLFVIFERFRQADEGTERKFGGTGLGLAISQSLCLQLGYHLEVASEVGGGTTFSVTLTEDAPPLVHRLPLRVQATDHVVKEL